MDDRLARVEAAVEDLRRAVESLERRIAAIEGSLARTGVEHDAFALSPLPDESPAPPTSTAADYDVVTVLSFVGRNCVALGGAYLLRALTDSGVLPTPIGIAAGLVYAMAWLVLADRAGSRGHWLSAAFHAAVASMVGFPLLWEAVTRFKLIAPGISAVILAAMTGAALAVAMRQRLHAIAWIAVIPSVATALVMIAATGFVLEFATFLIALGVATLWLGYDPPRWRFLRWPVAIVADVAVLTLAMRASTPGWSDPPMAVIAVQLLLLTAYLASIVVRTLVRGRDVIPFEVVQTVLALGVGFGGAVYVASVTGAGHGILAAINLAVGAGCYGVAFTFVARRQGVGHNFYFYTSLAIVLVLVSTRMLLADGAAAATLAALGVVSAWMAWRVGHIALTLHAAGYIFAGAVDAGLLTAASYALAAPASTAWPALTPAALLVLAATGVCWIIPMSPRARSSWGMFSRLPRLIIIAVLAWTAGGWAVALLAPLLARAGNTLDPGVVATIRTTVIAAAALALARLGRLDRFRESAHLVYPVLVAGGVKLVVEDLRSSRPATLFVALAFYGSALILAPRLLHRGSDRIPRRA